MNKNQTSGEYLAPNVKVVEVKVQQQILQVSPAATMGVIDYQNSDWDD